MYTIIIIIIITIIIIIIIIIIYYYHCVCVLTWHSLNGPMILIHNVWTYFIWY